MRVCNSKNEWDESVLDNGGHPFQLWGWGQVKVLAGWTAERILFTDDGRVFGGAQVLVKKLPYPFKSLAYVPRGSFGSEKGRNEALSLLADHVKSKFKSVVLTFEPDSVEFTTPDSWRKSENKILPKETILLNLNKTESDLLAVMAKKTRQYIRKSSADVKIRQAKSREDVQVCLELYKETAKRASFGLHSDQYYYDVFEQLADHSPLFIAYKDDVAIAFLWLAVSESIAYELYGGVSEEGQRLRANYALKWYAIRKCKNWGLKKYDFGGLIVGGVANFKQGWAEGETVLVGTIDAPLSPLYSAWTKGLPKAKRAFQKTRKVLKR